MSGLSAAPRLEADRLILRAHEAADFEACAAMWADPDVVRYISGKPSTREASWSRVLRYRGHWAMLGFGYWVVEAKEDGRFVGEVGFADYQREIVPSLAGRPEAGWVLNTAEHGKGFATEAMRAALHWVDATLRSETVCILDPAHLASRHVAEKLGYAEDARGTYNDQPTLIMARSRGERV